MATALPKYLYKYRPVDIHTIRLIVQSEAYFPSPLDFNDPFDCKANVKIDSTPEELDTFLRTLMSPIPPNIDTLVKKYSADNLAYSILAEKIEEVRIEQLGTTGVYCLSEVNDSVLMFSHYANGHRGVCLQFTQTGSEFFDLKLQVKYKPGFQAVSLGQLQKPASSLVEAWLAYKSADWEYEKEWRIVKLNVARKTVPFPAGVLSGVIFGCEMANKDKELVRSLVAGRSPVVGIFEARKATDHYRLNIGPA